MLALAIALHTLAAVVWVGGMFFAYLALRPASAALAPPERLGLWARTLGKFLPWVWVAVLTLLISGYWMIFMELGGMASIGVHVHIMQALGIVMMLLFMHLYFAPFKRLRRAVEAADWPAAGAGLNQIRILVGINLLIGSLVVAIAAGGRYF